MKKLFGLLTALLVINIYVVHAQSDTAKNGNKKSSFFDKVTDKLSGQKKNGLKDKKVKEIQISDLEDKGQTHTLGSSFSIIIKATLEDGKDLITKGAGNGKTSWDNYIIQVDGGSFNNGILTVNYDYKTIKNHTVILTAADAYDATIKKQFEIHLTYDGIVHLNFSGRSGRNGNSGRDGSTGQSGGNSSGMRGGDGGSGENGDDGEPGENGQDAIVYVKAMKDAQLSKDLLFVKAGNTIYVVDPSLAGVVAESNGGSGGMGGNGGRGGYGGQGAGCSCSGSSTNGVVNAGNGGSGGNGGNGGNGANGGNGGKVTFYVDPSAKKYSSVLTAYSNGGVAGNAGIAGSAGSGGPSGNPSSSNAGTDSNGNHYDFPSGKSANSGSSGRDGTGGSRAGRSGVGGPQASYLYQEVKID